jgi:hypothetical protein
MYPGRLPQHTWTPLASWIIFEQNNNDIIIEEVIPALLVTNCTNSVFHSLVSSFHSDYAPCNEVDYRMWLIHSFIPIENLSISVTAQAMRENSEFRIFMGTKPSQISKMQKLSLMAEEVPISF